LPTRSDAFYLIVNAEKRITIAGVVFQIDADCTRLYNPANSNGDILRSRAITRFDIGCHRNIHGGDDAFDDRQHFVTADLLSVAITGGEGHTGTGGGDGRKTRFLK
jgi:hypothetical protein